MVERGAAVAILARDPVRLEAARARLRAKVPGADVIALSVDVRDRNACAAAVDEVVAARGAPDWLIASAGIAEPGLFLEQPLDRHEEHWRSNYLGSLHLAHAAARHMAKAGGGRMIFVASGAALFGIYGYAAYSSSKFAVRGLAEVLRVELAPHGISVTLAYPPDTDTPQLAAERLTKPAATSEITEGGGVWAADAVAERILRAAARNAFTVAPGWRLTLAAWLHSLISPSLRRMQLKIVMKGSRAPGARRAPSTVSADRSEIGPGQ